MGRHQLVAACVAAVSGAAVLAAASPQNPQVLRAGAYLVQVDAYPERDGEPIRNLTAGDFELLEDGTPQTIDSVRFLEFPVWTPDQQRRDPRSQRESFELAADPANRLFVVYLNRMSWQLGNYVEPGLLEFLDRTIGPRDYVAVMTAMQSPGDLVFGQVTTAFKNEARRFLNVIDWMDPDVMSPEELELFTCFPGGEGEGLIARRRADDVYRDLEGLVTLLGSVRETRSTIIYVSPSMLDPSRNTALTRQSIQKPVILPPVAQMPPARGRGSFEIPGREILYTRCEDLKRATLETWSADRFKELLARARVANVAFSPINPRGLVADANLQVVRAAESTNDLMRTMASETGGVAIVNHNDMREGFRRVASSITAHYVLGYYSSNRAHDRKVRRLTVRLKATREQIRARREYRAPSSAEMAAASGPAAPDTPAPPAKPAVPDGLLRALAELDAADRRDPDERRPAGGPRTFRAASPPAAPWQPAGPPRFARTERLKLEWSGTELPTGVRLLNRDGQPLAVQFTITRDTTAPSLSASLALAPLAGGIYIVEAVLPDGTTTFLAFRIT